MKVAVGDTSSPSKNNPPENTFICTLYSFSAQCRGVRGEYTELNAFLSALIALWGKISYMVSFERFRDWDQKYFPVARENIGNESELPLWKSVYSWQAVFTELELRSLGAMCDVKPCEIPDVGKIHNLSPINLRTDIGIVDVIGMPGAGKDLMIEKFNALHYPKVLCAPEEGYFWTRGESPLSELRQRHIQVYGGIDMEIDELVDKIVGKNKSGTGLGVLNRSISDNFLAFAYSFFLSGHIGIADLIMSQKFFHYFQYSPTIRLGDGMTSVEDLTKATIILMVDPTTSIQRKDRTGRIMNEEFLSLLYSQYLRMISRFRESSQSNLIVLNMMGTINDNFDSFRNVIDHIIVK